jgi:hypothetical protein
MVKAKKQKKQSSLFWRIVITAVGVMLILLAVLRLLLFFFGTSTVADINVRRQGGANGGAPGQRYEWAVSYTFTDQNGTERSGYAVYRGSDYSVNVGSRVYYFSFASFLHALENDAEPGLSQPVMVALGVLLVFVMNKRKKTSKKKSTPVRKPLPSALPDDYDDSIEERFHNNHTN